jgi:hypothetical protein
LSARSVLDLAGWVRPLEQALALGAALASWVDEAVAGLPGDADLGAEIGDDGLPL